MTLQQMIDEYNDLATEHAKLEDKAWTLENKLTALGKSIRAAGGQVPDEEEE